MYLLSSVLFQVPLLIGAGLYISLASILMTRYPERKAMNALAVFSLAAAWCCICYAFQLSYTEWAEKLLWLKLGTVGFVCLAPSFYLFAHLNFYHSQEIRLPLVLLVATIPAIALVLSLTAEHHTVLYRSLRLAEQNGRYFLALQPGVGFYVSVAHAGLLTAIGSVLTWQRLRNDENYRAFGLFLVGGGAILGTAIAHLLRPGAVINPSYFGLAAAAIPLSMTLRRLFLFELMPLARSLIIKNMAGMVWIVDEWGQVTDLNDIARAISQRPNAQIIGRSIDRTFPEVAAIIARQPDASTSQEISIIRRGRAITLDTYVNPIMNAQGHVLGHTIVSYDITERKQTEEALRQSEALYRATVEDQLEMICRYDENCVFTFVNEAYCKYFGTTREETIGQSLWDLPQMTEVSKEEMRAALSRLTPDNPTSTTYHQFDGPNNSGRWRSWTRRAIFDEQGHVTEYLSVGRDVTEQRNAEEALKHSEELYRAIVDDQTEMLCRYLADGTLTFVNRPYCEIYGKSFQELVGTSIYDLPYMTDDKRQRIRRNIAGMTPSSPMVHYESETVMPDGSIMWRRWRQRGIFDNQGKIIECQGLGIDVTAQKRAEIALKQSEARFKAVVEDQTELVCRFNADGLLTFVNKAFAHYYNDTYEAFQGTFFLPYATADDRSLVLAHIRSLSYHHQVGTFDHREVLPDKQVVWRRWVTRAILDPDGNIIEFQGVGRDITAQKETEEQLRASEARYRVLAESTTALSRTLDTDQIFELILESLELVVPHDASSIMLHEKDQMRFVRARGYEKFNNHERLMATIYTLESAPNLRNMLEAGVPLVIADTRASTRWIKRPENDWGRSYLGVPIMLEGKAIGILNLDSQHPNYFTEEHVSLLEAFATEAAIAIRNARLYEEARRYAAEIEERNRELDAFTHTVAHDLNSPLSQIVNDTYLLDLELGKDLSPEARRYLNRIQTLATKMSEMISGLLLLASVGHTDEVTYSLDPTPRIEAAIKRFEQTIEMQGITVRSQEVYPPVIAYGPWLEEVFANLIGNAVKYFQPANPQPEIAVEGELTGDFVRFVVRDNGPGIDPAFFDSLFEVFTRVPSSQKQGLGIGLSIVKRIVTKLGGRVYVESKIEEGSTFFVELPAGKAKARKSPSKVKESTLSG